jgi:hypothetical protein
MVVRTAYQVWRETQLCLFVDSTITFFSFFSPLHKRLKQRQKTLGQPKRLFSECCNLDIHAITRGVQSNILCARENGGTERHSGHCLKSLISEYDYVVSPLTGLTNTRALSRFDPFHWIRFFFHSGLASV